MSGNTPWPAPGLEAFVEGGGAMSATIHDLWDRDAAYALAYQRAADIVIDCIRSSRMGYERDPLLLPVAFNYRQALELWLKVLIFETSAYLRRPCSKLHDHRIRQLWDVLKPLLLEIHDDVDQPADPGEIAGIDTCVADYAKHDPDSQAFRYARDVKGQPTLPHLKSADFDNLQLAVKALTNYFGATRDWLDALADGKADYEDYLADMRAEYESDMRAEYESDMRAEYESDMRAEYESDMRAEYESDMRAAAY